MTTTWTHQFIITNQNAGQSIKQTLKMWLLPQRIRGALRIKKTISSMVTKYPPAMNYKSTIN